MAKTNKTESFSFTGTKEDKELFDKVDLLLPNESRAEFFRRVAVKEAKKILAKQG